MTRTHRNRYLGLGLALFVLGIMGLSFFVIKTRGRIPEPTNLPKWKRILRGL